MARAWHNYWFAPAPYFDLAAVRILAVALQLYIFSSTMENITPLTLMSEGTWQPLTVLNLLNLPFGWGFRPSFEALEIIFIVGMVAGTLALLGLLTNLSLVVFTITCIYCQAFAYSFGDFHHPQAVMMIAVAALAISPSGRVLSVDSLIKRYFGSNGERHSESWLEGESQFAGWPIKLV